MKKINLMAILAMATCIAVSCNKENVNPDGKSSDPVPTSDPAGIYPASVSAAIEQPQSGDGTKMSISGTTLSWSAGDQIAVFKNSSADYTGDEVITTMSTALGDGSFSGSVPYPGTTPFYLNFVSPSSVVDSLSTIKNYGNVFCVNLPKTQDGQASKIGNYFITGAANVACTMENQTISISDFTMNKPYVTVIKTTVPAELNASKIEIKAYAGEGARGIAGKGKIKVNNQQIKNGEFAEKTVTIQRDDKSNVSGETFACIIPFKKDNLNTKCDVDKISFTITNASEQSFTFSKAITPYVVGVSAGLLQGYVYNLGSFPTSCVKPKYSTDSEGKVVITAAPAEATIYYTTNGDDPTTSSSVYSEPIEISSTTTFKAFAVCAGLGNSQISETTVYTEAVAPVLSISTDGKLTFEAVTGQTYTYSTSTEGAPGEPTTAWPADGISLTTSGTHYFKVMATAGSKTATTNAVYYFHKYPGSSAADFTVNASTTENDKLSPYSVSNVNTSINFKVAKDASNGAWYFNYSNDTAKQKVATDLQIGLSLQYASNVSFYAILTSSKSVNVYFKGEKQTSVKSTASQWTNIWSSSAKCTSEDKFYFCPVNGSRYKAWGVLEQGFDFDQSKATVNNEKPANGGTVAY